MVRHFVAAAAAIILTGTAVAALAETPSVTINKAGAYCLHYGAATGSRVPRTECKSKAAWAQEGVTFARR